MGAWTSAQESALNAILNDSLPRIYTGSSGYGVAWINQVKPLTKDQVKRIIKGAMYYYGLGYSPTDYKSFFRNLQKSLPDIQPLLVTKVLALISGITPDKYPADYALLKTGQVSSDLQAQQAQQRSEEKKAEIAFEIQDKINRGVGAVASAGLDAAKTISAALPWYLRPTTLLPVALLGLGAYAYIQTRGASKLLRPFYKSNPISKAEVKRAQAQKTFEMFHDKKPKKTKVLPRIDASELVELGDALEIGYRSSKWTGKRANYLHKFGKGVKLMCTPDRKTLVIHGGQMDVQDVGIVN